MDDFGSEDDRVRSASESAGAHQHYFMSLEY
jgi:hypothetical protein